MRLKFYFLLLTVLFTAIAKAQLSSYSFAQSSGTYTSITGGTVVATATASSGAGSLDDVNFALPAGIIPFTFVFNGTGYTTLNVNTNGYITFGATSPPTGFPYTPISDPTAYAGAIAAFGGDINSVFNLASTTGEIRDEVVGAAPNREFVIQWKNFRPAFSTSTTSAFVFDFQIRLGENGTIKMVYGGNLAFIIGSTAQSGTRQIGLRGATNADFINRSSAAGTVFTASTAGTLNTSTQAFNTSTTPPGMPSSGLTYTFAPPPPCTTPPAGGTTVSSSSPVCSGVNFDLSVTSGAVGTGLTYQWESSPNGLAPWTSIGGATNAGLTTSQTVTTWYRRKTTCSGIDGFSTGLQLTMNAPSSCYCTVTFPSNVEPITLVNFATINNATSATVNGTPALENFTAITATVLKTQTYPIIVKGNTDGSFTTFIDVYIDWNQDGDFVDAGENYFIGTIFNSTGVDAVQATGNIPVPVTALDGITRMRVMKKFSSSALPCNAAGFGQAEDYTLNVVTPPCILTCPANITVNVDPNQCGAVVTYPAPTTTGVCGTVTASPASGSFFPKGITTVTVTSSAGGVTCSFTVTVVDNQLPTITCPGNITRNNDPGVCGAVVTFAAPVAADNCPGVTVTSVPASGSVFPKGTTTVVSTATDAAGNTTACTFTVTVNDTQAPVITCPANIVKSTDANQCGAVVSFLPTATDNCLFGIQTPVSITQSTSTAITPANSAICGVFPVHNDNSFWRAYDLAPLALAGPFTINTVTFGIQSADAGGAATSQPVTVRLYTSAGAFPGGVRTQVASQTYTIPDQTGTLFTATLTAPPTVPANSILVLELFTPDGTAAGNSFIIGSNTAAQTGTSYISAAACTIPTPTDIATLGFPDMHIVLNAAGTVPVPGSGIVSVPASGSFFPKGTTTVTSTATDNAGNTAVCTFTVTVNDTQAPAFTCPSNITATTAVGSCTIPVNYTVPATDNCPGVTVVRTVGPASGSAFPIGVTTVTHVATDASGNATTCTFTVTVNDGQLPVIATQPVNRTVCAGIVPTFSVTATNTTSYQWQLWNGTTWNNIAGATSATLTLPAATSAMNDNSYRVIVTGLCSSVTSGFATLFVNPLPTVQLTASSSPVLLPTQTTGLVATVNPTGGTIAWFKNGAPYTGSTTNLGVGDVGTYRFVYTDLNGCVNTSGDVVVSAQVSDKFYVFPNPNVGAFSIRFYNSSNQPVTVRVYNSVGEKVLTKSVVTTALAYSKIDVDLGAGVSGGIYLVELHGSDGKLIGAKRIIVGHR